MPADGIVKATAIKATAGATTDMEKARAIYDWVVDTATWAENVPFECPLRWPGTFRRPAGAACLRFAHCQIGLGLQKPWTTDGQSHQGPALSHGSVPSRTRLGSGGPGRRMQGSSGGASGESSTWRWHGVEGAQAPVRLVGDELDGI